jgi:glycosyltransferase involved in cell wall biosynthesis
MNIVLIAAGGWHSDSPGGAYKLPSDFARYLAGQGRRVAYLCPNWLVDRGDPELCDGVEVYRYSFPGASSPSVVNLIAHLHRSRAIAARIASHGTIEALLGHSPLQYFGALSSCRPMRKCYAVHSPFVAELQSNRSGRPELSLRLAWAISGLLEARIYSQSDLVHCFSEYTLGQLREKYERSLAGKCTVLPAWVNTNRFTPARETRQRVRERLGLPWDPQVTTFFTVRRLVPRMGVDTLLEAAAILSKEGHSFKLVIAGEGPQLQPLRTQCSALSLGDRVAFLGRVSEEQLVDVFRAGDCFVLPTRSLEGFGLIILEAYACGTPVIAVPVGAIPEVMGASFRDWLARDNSPAALAERMRDFIINRLIADQARLRQRALEFDFDTVAALHERVLLQAKPSNVIIPQAVGGGLLL